MRPPNSQSKKTLPSLSQPIKKGSIVKWEEQGKWHEGEVILTMKSKKVLVQKQTKKQATVSNQDFDIPSIVQIEHKYFCNIGGTKTLCTVKKRLGDGYEVAWSAKGEAVYVPKRDLKLSEEQKKTTPEKENQKRKREPGTAPVTRKRLRQATPVMNSTPIGGSKPRAFLNTPSERTNQFATPTHKPRHMTPMGEQFQALQAKNIMLEKQKRELFTDRASLSKLWKQKCKNIHKEYEDSEALRKKELEDISELYKKKEQFMSEEFQKKLMEVEESRQTFEKQVEERNREFEEIQKQLECLKKENGKLEEEKRIVEQSRKNSKTRIKMPKEIMGKTKKNSLLFHLKHIRYYEELVRWSFPKLSKADYARRNGMTARVFQKSFREMSEENVILEKDALIETKDDEIKSLKKEIEDHKVASDVQVSLFEKIEKEKQSVEAGRISMEKAKNEEIAALGKEIIEQQSKVQSYESDLENIRAAKLNIEKEVEDLKQSQAQATGESQAAKLKIEKELEALKEKHSKASQTAKKANETLNLMKMECTRLKTANTKRKNTIDKMRQQADRQKRELASDRKKLWTVQSQLDVKTLESKEATESLEKQQKSVLQLTQALEKEKVRVQNQKSSVDTLKCQINELMQQNQKQQGSLQEVNQQLDRLLLKSASSMTMKDLKDLQNTFTRLGFRALEALENRKKRK